MRKKLPTNPLEKRLILTDKKITSMLEKIQSDIIKLEVNSLYHNIRISKSLFTGRVVTFESDE